MLLAWLRSNVRPPPPALLLAAWHSIRPGEGLCLLPGLGWFAADSQFRHRSARSRSAAAMERTRPTWAPRLPPLPPQGLSPTDFYSNAAEVHWRH